MLPSSPSGFPYLDPAVASVLDVEERISVEGTAGLRNVEEEQLWLDGLWSVGKNIWVYLLRRFEVSPPPSASLVPSEGACPFNFFLLSFFPLCLHFTLGGVTTVAMEEAGRA